MGPTYQRRALFLDQLQVRVQLLELLPKVMVSRLLGGDQRIDGVRVPCVHLELSDRAEVNKHEVTDLLHALTYMYRFRFTLSRGENCITFPVEWCDRRIFLI